MNRIFSLIWNEQLCAYVAAPESARRCGKGGRLAGALVLAAAPFAAHALPTGGQVSAGQAGITQSGSALTVNQQSQNLAINWSSFGIGPSESVSFAQPNASAIALNRVLGAEPSQIYGRLSSNGQVWILNPNGVLFGGGAQVNVGGLLASTLNISDADFLAGKRTFSGSGGAVANQGQLTAADGGYVALLGGRVSNEGVIQARLGTAALGAGSKITLDFAGDKLLNLQVDEGAVNALTQNKQLIQADGGSVLLSARAANALLDTVVNNTGVIEARTVENKNGTIRLLGDAGAVNVAGTLDASAPSGGDGGLIHTSGAAVKVGDSARITTAAPAGQTGQWLIDPTNFLITPGAGSDVTGAALGNQLNVTNVTILSSSGHGGGSGDIMVNDNVSWSSPNSLTLSAYHDVQLVKGITNSGTGGVTLRADNTGSCIAGASNCGTIRFAPQARISVNGGVVNLYYNPVGSNNVADANGNGPTYANPTDYSGHVTLNGGSTLTSWMLVNDVNQLQAMNTNPAGNYALGRDVDASATAGWNGGAGFVPVGSENSAFDGAFDGLGHSVNALTANRPGTDDVGLFGRSDGQISNVTLADGVFNGRIGVGALAGHNTGNIRYGHSVGAIKGSESVGGLIGLNEGPLVTDSSSAGTVSGGFYVGGLIGRNGAGSVTNAHSTVEVTSDSTTIHYVGGLVGYNSGTVANSYFAGALIGYASPTGGLVGSNSGTVINSYNTGAVSGYSGTGGLVGFNYGAVTNSHNTGTVRGGLRYVGGLVAYSDTGATIENSYSTGSVSGGFETGGLVGYNKGMLSTSYSTGVVDGDSWAGGLVGRNEGTVRNTFSRGDVTGGDFVGGLIGYNTGAVSESHSTGAANGFITVGGLVGSNLGTLSNSYSTGAADGRGEVGGLVGSNTGTVSTSYSTGVAIGNNPLDSFDIGGLVGVNTGTVGNSFSTGAVTGYDSVGGLVGVNDGSIAKSFSTGAVNGHQLVGGLVGVNRGTVADSSSASVVNGSGLVVGGLIGSNDNRSGRGIVTNSSSTGAVTGYEYVGGLAGWSNGAIRDSFSSGNVTSTLSDAGGFVGLNQGTVHNSSSTGNVIGSDSVGGLIGSNEGTVSNSHSTGAAHSTADINSGAATGGLVGYNYGTVANSYASGAVSGYLYVGGLAGYNTSSGSITNSHSASSVSGYDSVGGLVGYNAGAISDSYGSGKVVGHFNGGGLVGKNESGATVTHSHSTGDVAGYDSVGGLVGNNAGTVSYSHSSGNASGNGGIGGLAGLNTGAVSNSYSTGGAGGFISVGGLVGGNLGTLSNTYSTGAASGYAQIGGLVGSNGGTVSTSYSTGATSGTYGVGGLVGINTGTVTTSYWDTTTSGQTTSAGGTGLTDTQMKQKSSFVGFDFLNIWDIDEGASYPFLRAQ